jgi:hypothetical protein
VEEMLEQVGDLQDRDDELIDYPLVKSRSTFGPSRQSGADFRRPICFRRVWSNTEKGTFGKPMGRKSVLAPLSCHIAFALAPSSMHVCLCTQQSTAQFITVSSRAN